MVLPLDMHGVAPGHAWCCPCTCMVLPLDMHGVAPGHAWCCPCTCMVLPLYMHVVALVHACCCPWTCSWPGKSAGIASQPPRCCLEQKCALIVSCIYHGFYMLQLESPDQDMQARKKYAAATKRKKTGQWHWQHSEFSKVVRFLAPSEAAAGVLGMGGWSVGPVQ